MNQGKQKFHLNLAEFREFQSFRIFENSSIHPIIRFQAQQASVNQGKFSKS